MSTTMRPMRLLLLAALLGGTFATGVEAQGVRVEVPRERGWVGLRVDFTLIRMGGEERTVVVVKEVLQDSPAREAGLRPGDTLTHIDGQPISQKVFTAMGRTLEPGDLVRLTIHRDGRDREVLLEAGRRPPQVQGRRLPDPAHLSVRLDSMRGAIIQNLDSMRIHVDSLSVRITPAGADSLEALALTFLAPRADSTRPPPRGYTYRLLEPGVDTLASPDTVASAPPPWSPHPELFVPFQLDRAESRALRETQEELRELRKEITGVRRKELARIREIQGGLRGAVGAVEEAVKKDEEIRRLRSREDTLLARQRELAERLNVLSREVAKSRWVETEERSRRSRDATAGARAREAEAQARLEEAVRTARQRSEAAAGSRYEYRRPRPTNIQIIGQSFVAGAQLAPLNPSLGEYFGTEEGVLVMEVVEGTPAQEWGLQAGDVIVRAGDQEVSSLEDLRFSLGYLEGRLRVRIIRKGKPLQLVFSREP